MTRSQHIYMYDQEISDSGNSLLSGKLTEIELTSRVGLLSLMRLLLVAPRWLQVCFLHASAKVYKSSNRIQIGVGGILNLKTTTYHVAVRDVEPRLLEATISRVVDILTSGYW
ncbi:hypothetical protein RRG08_062202 [Elysia crispata]|uniref:Uncharacterized protein n=1 Tax=Elysia crispata TaxID=231223 RepID=A0AAE0Y963_9GAST|nr:hypothetical protein RRG08_062202 [Elysia crispata]